MLLNQFTGQASAVVDAPAREVFEALVDIDRLPEWNAAVEKVITPPDRPMSVGAEWVVKVHPKGIPPWPSRATCTAYDAVGLRFAHRSRTDDGNPSFALWDWHVTPTADGRSRVEVTWAANPRTFWRRLILARIRRPGLQREVDASVQALSYHLAKDRASA